VAKTPFKGVTSREIYGADISGLQDAVNKLETVLEMDVASIESHTLFPVEDQPEETLHRRIYEGDIRNWLESPVPVVRRNGAIVPAGEYVLYAAQGMVVFHEQQPPGITVTADFSYVRDSSPFSGHVGAGGTAHVAATAEAAGFLTAGDKLRLNALDFLRYRRLGLYHAGITAAGMAPLTTSANNIDLLPFYVPVAQSFDRVAVNVTTAAAGSARLGVYADSGAIYPGALILDAGVVTTGTTGIRWLEANLSFLPGLYWLARLQDAAPSLQGLASTGMLALGSEDLGAAWITGYRLARPYADGLPTAFPLGAVQITGARPAVFLRRA